MWVWTEVYVHTYNHIRDFKLEDFYNAIKKHNLETKQS